MASLSLPVEVRDSLITVYVYDQGKSKYNYIFLVSRFMQRITGYNGNLLLRRPLYFPACRGMEYSVAELNAALAWSEENENDKICLSQQ